MNHIVPLAFSLFVVTVAAAAAVITTQLLFIGYCQCFSFLFHFFVVPLLFSLLLMCTFAVLKMIVCDFSYNS